MELIPVSDSSNIIATAHDSATGTMRVQFKGGATYEAAGVSEEEHSALRQSHSKGSHFHNKLKGKYAWKKL